jgi:thioredoxin-related protein
MKTSIKSVAGAVMCFMIFLSLPLVSRSAGGDEAALLKFRPITLQEAIAAAKKENKLVFVHGYTDWCHYCKYMKDSVYTDKEVADVYNSTFVCVKVNMEKEGKKINDELKIHTYPAFIFYDGDGDIVHRAAGRRYKQPFLELAKEATDPKRQMRTFKNKFESGTATPYEAQFYFRMLETSGIDAQSFINDYLMKQSDANFSDPNNWRIIYDIIKDPTMPAMNRILDKRAELESKYTKDSVNNKLINVHNYYLMQFVQQLDSAGYEAAKKKIMANPKLAGLSEKICAYAEINKLKMKSQYDEYKVEGQKFVEKYAMDDARRINDVCGVLYERFSADKELMNKVEQWLKRSVSLEDIYKGNHLLASVSVILGKKEQALNAANHAIEVAKISNNDYRQTDLLLARIKEMQ